MRPLDDVLKDEYNEYKEYIKLQKRYMYDKIRKLTGNVPKNTLNIIEEVTNEVLPDPDRIGHVTDHHEISDDDDTPSAVTPSAVTPSAVTPSAVTPSAVTPSAVTPSAVTSSAVPNQGPGV